MRTCFLTAIFCAALAVFPSSARAADDHGKGDKTKELADVWGHLPKAEREKALADFVRHLPEKDRAKFETFFHDLDHPHEEAKAKRIGVENGLFKGAIEVSLWTIAVFFILFFVLRAFAWGPIVEGLNKREQSIAQDRREADLARQEAGHMRNELTAQKAKANDEIRLMMDKARLDADALAAEREAQQKATLAAERDRLQRETQIELAQGMKLTLEQGARLASLLSAKVIKKHLTEDDHRALLDEALKEFRASAAARVSDLTSATT